MNSVFPIQDIQVFVALGLHIVFKLSFSESRVKIRQFVQFGHSYNI